MKLIVSEIHTTDNKCVPMIEVELNDSSALPNITRLNDIDWEMYMEEQFPNLLNFTHGFFDSLNEDTLNKLNTIYSLDENFINYKLWNYFVAISGIEIPPIKKINKYLSKEYNHMDQYYIKKYFNNISDDDIRELLKSQYKIILKELPFLNRTTDKISTSLDFLNDNDSYFGLAMKSNSKTKFIISYEVEANNELELLYSFLDIIFSSKFRYYIKKCENENCKKFYITNKHTSKYCNRTTCNKTILNGHKKYQYYSDCQKLDKNIRSFFNSQDDDVYRTFLIIYDDFRQKNRNRTEDDTIHFLNNIKCAYSKYKKDNPNATTQDIVNYLESIQSSLIKL